MNTLKKRNGQGMTEYIVILAVILLAFFAFWPKIKTSLISKGEEVADKIKG